MLYTTHYMEEAERLCDRGGIIDGGVLQARRDTGPNDSSQRIGAERVGQGA